MFAATATLSKVWPVIQLGIVCCQPTRCSCCCCGVGVRGPPFLAIAADLAASPLLLALSDDSLSSATDSKIMQDQGSME